eukprot:scaffold13406_cov29-Tisochrysis_lutea.AAC.2
MPNQCGNRQRQPQRSGRDSVQLEREANEWIWALYLVIVHNRNKRRQLLKVEPRLCGEMCKTPYVAPPPPSPHGAATLRLGISSELSALLRLQWSRPRPSCAKEP